MKSKKIVFIDVDGTLVGDDQTLLPSTIEAITSAKQQGHLLFLCTGRSKPELHDYIIDLGFHGFICANGGSVEYDNQILMHKEISKEEIKDVVDFFQEHHIDFYLESRGGLYASEHCVSHLLHIVNMKHKDDHVFTKVVIEHENLYRDDVSKICFLGSDYPFSKVQERYQDIFHVMSCTVPIFGKESGELAVKGVSKSSAIQYLLEYLQMDQKDTIAIGDGMNDMDMLQYCHIGIAMGNGDERLKAIADDISDDVDNDGLYKAFQKYQLI